MPVIERIMKAYASKHELSPAQAARVRAELSSFIGELMSGVRREPSMLPERKSPASSGHPQRGDMAESPPEMTERTESSGR